MKTWLKAVPVWFCCLPAAYAHHAFAPHFDAERPVDIRGTVIRFDARNPHSYLHVQAQDADGRLREFVCESHGATQLARNGIRADMLAPGTPVHLQGQQARRDPYRCFFRSVEFADGRVLGINGPRGAADPVQPAPRIQRSDIYGTWLMLPSDRSVSGPQPMLGFLTPAGQAAVAAYDPFIDDPVFRCDPVGIRRVWLAPGTPLSIRREDDRVILRFEWMDVERVVHLDLPRHPAGTPRSTLGHSIGRFEGDTLVIETAYFTAGVLNQYVERPGEPTVGLLHSDALSTVERLRFDRQANELVLEIDMQDPLFFTRPFPTAGARYAPSNLELQPFNCSRENADGVIE